MLERRLRQRGLIAYLAVAVSSALVVSAIAESAAKPPFTDITAISGLDFVHQNGMTGELYLLEVTGAGAALFDYDNDGDLDLYLVQGHILGPGKGEADAVFPSKHPQPLIDRLYRNDLEVGPSGSRTIRWVDVTTASGIVADGYGMGVTAGDVDGDGWTDLYIANYGSNQLWRNTGPDSTGTVRFEEITAKANADDRRWSITGVLFDYDQDGDLDLYVANYVDFDFVRHRRCATVTGAADYCAPLAYKAYPDRLLENRGAVAASPTRFVDVTESAGINGIGSALGAVTSDFDNDGDLDLYVANDLMPNFLYVNQGKNAEGRVTFVDDALLAGAAVNRDGQPESSMGVDAGDIDNDGDDDIAIAHLDGETNTLYVGDGTGLFLDLTREAGMATPSWNFTAFGLAFLDYDNDGWLDLIAANGAVRTIESQARTGEPYPVHQTNQLFRNRGVPKSGGKGGVRVGFVDVTAEAGAAFAPSEVSRGIAIGDLDNDGDSDIVIANSAGPARVLRNDIGNTRPWLGLELRQKNGALAQGARVTLHRSGAPSLTRRAGVDGSFASSRDPRVLLGLGGSSAIDRVTVRWPDGSVESFDAPGHGSYHRLDQGRGRAAELEDDTSEDSKQSESPPAISAAPPR